MSTSALICYVYEDGWFECNTIQYDGYPKKCSYKTKLYDD